MERALAGELVEVGPSREGRAPLLRVVEPSVDRVEPRCSVFGRCGGCALQHASDRLQRATKVDEVERLLGARPPAFSIVEVPPTYGYRVRVRLAFRDGAVGHRAFRDHAVVEPERCEVLVPALEEARRVVTTRLAPTLEGGGELSLGLATAGAVTMRIDSAEAQGEALFRAARALVDDGVLAGVAVKVGGASVDAVFGDVRELGHDSEGRALLSPVGSFRQAHREAARVLGEAILSRLGEATTSLRVLELFAGHGNFTLGLAARATVTAVESDREATAALRANLDHHGLTASVVETDARAYVGRLRPGSFDIVVLDPPRAGARSVLRELEVVAPSKVIYVACDPASFARDAKLVASSYDITDVTLFDLFPQTTHVELVATLERRADAPRPRKGTARDVASGAARGYTAPRSKRGPRS